MLSGGPGSRTLSSSKYRSVSMATATRTDHMIHTLAGAWKCLYIRYKVYTADMKVLTSIIIITSGYRLCSLSGTGGSHTWYLHHTDFSVVCLGACACSRFNLFC